MRASPLHRQIANRPVTVIAKAVRRWPAVVALAAVALTVGMAFLAGQARTSTDNDGMAPDNPKVKAAETLAERFAGADEEVVQILVDTGGAPAVSADGLEAATAIEEAVRSSDAGPLLADRADRPGAVGWLLPAQMALEQQDLGGSGIDDETVADAYDAGLVGLGSEQAGFAEALLPDGTDAATADGALMVVFLDTGALPDDERWEALTAVETDLADAVADVDLPPGVNAAPFSMTLLFADFDDRFDDELTRLFAGAFGIIVVILAFVYWVRPGMGVTRARAARRSAADVALSMAAIIMAVLWMQGLATLLGPDYLDVIGPMSAFAQVIPVLLIGLGVDYAIHLASRYREEVGAGATVSRGVTGAVGAVGAALVLATVTTAVGFLTNVVNPIPDLRDFGILAAAGIVAAFLLMLTFVPAMRLLLDRRAERADRLPAAALGRTTERALPGTMAKTAVLARRAPVATLIVTAMLAGLGVFGLSQLETRFSQTDMIPEDSPALATLEAIEERFAGGFGETTEVLVTGDVATPEAHNALVGAHEALADVEGVATLGGRPAAESVVTLLAQLLAPGPDGAPAAPAVAEAAARAEVGEDLRVPADADVAGLYEAVALAAPEAAGELVATGSDGAHRHARVAIQTTAGEEGAADLDDALAAAFADIEATGASAVATSDSLITDVIVDELSDSQVSSLLVTLTAAMLLLVATFAYERRRPLLGVLTILPVALVVLWTFGMMALTGIPFGPVTATIAAVSIGIGLPYSIHVTTRFIEERARHADAGAAITATVRHTGGAMAGSALTTMAGFGILATSSLLPFRQLGLVTVYAVGLALLAATLVLPSMLVLWDRWHGRGDQNNEAAVERTRVLVEA